MDWSNDMVLEFLHNFETEPTIWDPKHAHNKKKHLVAEAWRRLKSNLSFENKITIEELKKKKDSLMAYYRIHLNKIKNNAKSGGEEYKTSWFAFQTMHSFLGPVYERTITLNPEEANKTPEFTYQSLQYDDESTNSSQSNNTVHSSPRKKKRKHSSSEIMQAKKLLDHAYTKVKRKETHNKADTVHECDLYAELLATKLKKLNEDRRTILMHNIDNLVFQELMESKAQQRAASAASSYDATSPQTKTELNFL